MGAQGAVDRPTGCGEDLTLRRHEAAGGSSRTRDALMSVLECRSAALLKPDRWVGGAGSKQRALGALAVPPGIEGAALHSPRRQIQRSLRCRPKRDGRAGVRCGGRPVPVRRWAACVPACTDGGEAVWSWLWWGDGMRPSGECKQPGEQGLRQCLGQSVSGWGHESEQQTDTPGVKGLES